MNVLDRIDKSELRDLLGKGWLTHDGMWFYHTYQKLRIEAANELNKAAIQSLAAIEVNRVKGILGIDKERFDTLDELLDFMLSGLELTLPDSVFKKMQFTSSSADLIHWDWEVGQCFAYKGIKQIGAIDRYRCGVIYRIECWLEALGVKFSIHPRIEGCLMHEKGLCEGTIQVHLPV